MARKKGKAKKGRRPGIILWLIIAAVLLLSGLYFMFRIFGPNTQPFHDHKYFYIRTGSTYKQVIAALADQGIIRNINSFEWVAGQLHYKEHVRAGRYKIHAGMSNFAIAKLLRSGRQTPVRLVINKLRTKADLIQLVSDNLEADSGSLSAVINDPVYLRRFGFDTSNVMCFIIPDTYEFYWNTDAEKVFSKLEKAYDIFWDSTRRAEANALGLSPNKVVILASIVEEETNKNDEKPMIASVYLNRLRTGMRLSADPTVKFALNDFTLRRIYRKYTEFVSPYNTYLHPGLPPGPICTPSIKTIDAVLHAPDTDYLYFCAREDLSGYHAFAKTFKEHLQNAKRYQAALDRLNIQ
jgi:UPF0755 protein